jgi:hypothetical protein
MESSELARKLAIKPGMAVLVQNAPPEFPSLLSPLPEGSTFSKPSEDRADCIIAFVRSKADVQASAPAAITALGEDGLLWFAYPKKTSALKSDLSRDTGWEPVFTSGYDSVAQISIDATWTGFRFRPKHLIGKRTR